MLPRKRERNWAQAFFPSQPLPSSVPQPRTHSSGDGLVTRMSEGEFALQPRLDAEWAQFSEKLAAEAPARMRGPSLSLHSLLGRHAAPRAFSGEGPDAIPRRRDWGACGPDEPCESWDDSVLGASARLLQLRVETAACGTHRRPPLGLAMPGAGLHPLSAPLRQAIIARGRTWAWGAEPQGLLRERGHCPVVWHGYEG
mmetsp:Transcript_126369/g.282378  ORF Transcript_126369/g.282378 Transcript_126369/m.282378 type:complete len:198 (+) Transcript_126369:68-661(+)